MTEGSRLVREYLERVSRGEAPHPPVADTVGFRLTGVSEGEARVSLQVSRRHHNPFGTIHGGIICDIADAAMAMALATTMEPTDVFTTLELKINFLKPVSSGEITAIGKVIKRGRQVSLVECEVLDESGALVAKGSSTCMFLKGEQTKGRNLKP